MMKVTVSNNIRIQEPTPEIQLWAEKTLTLPNPDYAKKVRLGFWTGNTPKTLALYEKRARELVLPFGMLKKLLPMLHDCTCTSRFEGHPPIDFGDSVPLYEYQETAVQAMVRAQYGLLQSAAGSGKTQMGIALIQQQRGPALWLCHTADLLRQSMERAERYVDPDLLGTITEGKVHIGAGITFATIQTMCNLDLAQYRDLWQTIIVDEAHRVSGSPTQMTRYFKVLNSLAARHKYGLTATPNRSDGLIQATYALLGEVAYAVPDAAIAEKIMKVGIVPVLTGRGLDEACMNPDGTLNYTGLIGSLTKDEGRTRLIAETIAREQGHSCLILSDRIEHLNAILALLPEEMREKAALVTGRMQSRREREKREQSIEQMRTGETKYLFATYSLCKEGLDIPRLDRLFLTTPIKYQATVIQAIGRIARTHEGKGEPIAYDFVDDRIPYCVTAFKQRRRHYRKIGAYFKGGKQ